MFNYFESLFSFFTENRFENTLYDYEQRPFICQICNRGFRSMGDLRTHRVVHTKRDFECKACGKKFYKSSNLKSHERIHTG